MTPLPVAWMLQPLVGADPHLQLAIVIGVVSGRADIVELRLMAEFGVVGISAIWVAALIAVRQSRLADALDPADENSPQ